MTRFQPMLATAALLSLMTLHLSSSSMAQAAFTTPGGYSNSYSGQITGNGVVQYGLETRPFQRMTVTLNTNNPSSQMNIFKDGNAQPLCAGSARQNICTFRVERGASYRVLIFLTRDAAQRGESARFTLTTEEST
ncbi:hypothetical protein DJFAAGMI_04236 [Comamonas sp. PE63]|uniref:DNA breaking-rejoining protein n=1 Tax=Comamonas brasiliensis TaxID=1812482 RepID=A0ABS5LY66_9BURK|nr:MULTISPECIES: hypothetical protein [Comamonas]MBS3021463.1 hypothetical protein [Comamonas sp. PE63]